MTTICDRSEHFVFSDLYIGEVFKFNNVIYMRIPEVLHNNTKYNAVQLTNGELECICQGQNIKKYCRVEVTVR